MAPWTLRPLRRPQAVFAAIAVVLAATLAALSWRVVEQDRAIEIQERTEELARSAAAIEAALLQLRARVEQDLDLIIAHGRPLGDAIPGGSGAATVSIDGAVITVTPKGAVAYVPDTAPARTTPDDRFDIGERDEFQKADLSAAAAFYRAAASSPDPVLRGGALLRLGRVQIKANAQADALATYGRLTELGPIVVEGIPADLLGRAGRLDLLHALGRDGERTREALELGGDLESGRWQLTRATYLFYRDRIGAAAGSATAARASTAFAAALDDVWREWRRRAADGAFQLRSTADGHPAPTIVLARGTRDRLAVFLASPAWLRAQLTPTLASLSGGFVGVSIADDKGVRLLEDRATEPGTARMARGVPALGWTIEISSTVPRDVRDQQAARRRLLLSSVVLAIGLVMLAAYALGRSVVRELAVARLQADFVAAVSHEFRTPLSSLRQLTELLADGRVPDEGRRRAYYHRLQRETERLQRLVEGLLDFNRMEAGAHEFRFETFDAAAFLRDLARDFSEEAEGRAHRLECRIPPPGLTVRADREALGRAIWNLLDNAVKYSPEGTTVTLEVAAAAGGIRISVQDEGVGIPPGQQQRIFEKFVRAPGHPDVRGTGLGLAMAMAIARGHGGDITVCSDVGHGSTFTLTLPAAPRPRIAEQPVTAQLS